MSTRQKIILIVAGGKGTRMGTAIPKQFLLLKNKPILMHTIERFYAFDATINILVVLPEHQQPSWRERCITHHFDIPHQIVSGGETRYHSVKNALRLVSSGCTVGIHDGVRPLVSETIIRECFMAAETFPAVVPAIPLSDSIREINQQTGQSKPVDRQQYRLVQTPQVFWSEILLQAYQSPYKPEYTDDASVVEPFCNIHLIEGDKENLKITTPLDRIVAEALLNEKTTCPQQ
jgi:2-C-methyl-D-erythritol 4-phosphate cytidylyltransferase